MIEILIYIVVILGSVLASSFFAGYETGLISLNRVRVHHQAQRNDRRSIILERFVSQTDRLLGTTLAGNNLANVLVSIFTTSLFVRCLGGSAIVEIAADIVVSVVVLVLGEIAPKSLFRRYPHRLCRSFADLLNAAAWLFAPLVLLLSLFMRLLARLGHAPDQRARFSVTREELKHLAREGEVGGELSAEERRMIQGVFDFPFKTVYEVMVPLNRTVTVSRDTTTTELQEIAQRTGFGRLPVRDGAQLVGVVNVYEILFGLAGQSGGSAEELIHEPLRVLSTERINHVLPRMQHRRIPLSIVINPEGQHVGIITIEDILEEIVGEVEG